MTRPRLAVSQFRLKNFKAIRDSGTIRFTPLTVFIGNNGVGKSSVIEGLETLKRISDDGLDEAMQYWHEFEHIWNQATPHLLKSQDGRQYYTNPMAFRLTGGSSTRMGQRDIVHSYNALSEITQRPGQKASEVFFYKEQLRMTLTGQPNRTLTRSISGEVEEKVTGRPDQIATYPPDESLLSREPSLSDWQFMRLNPDAMTEAKPLRRVGGRMPLAPDGSNIAEYLLDIRNIEPHIIEDIIETLQFVLPYAKDVRSVITSEVGHSVFLQLAEQNFQIPGWLFSTGTLRVLALLAVLRNPYIPPLIVIEEIENGLDPRTINMLVEEIREVVRTGRSQIIITTHSPYLLDLLPLASLVFVQRTDDQPQFSRPGDDESIQRWCDDFAPGQLYTMGRFRHR